MSSRGNKKKISPQELKIRKLQEEKAAKIKRSRKNAVVIISVILMIAIVITIALTMEKNSNYDIVEDAYTLIGLGSSTCGPCVQLQPVLESMRKKYKNKINILYYDIYTSDRGEELANYNQISTIPTLIYLDREGNEVYRSAGFKTQAQFEADFRRLGWIS